MPEDKKPSHLKLSPEAKVGLFVLLGIILLVYMSLRIGGIKFGRAEGYKLTVDFDSASGLDKNASVRVAGVEIGRVEEIELKDNKAHLILRIKPNIKIGRDFTAVLTTKGLLGEKYLELVPGTPNAPPLKNGEMITHTTSYADMDKLVTILSSVATDVKSVTESLSKVLGGAEGETTLRNIVKNIEDITVRVDRLIANNDERVGSILKNLDQFTAALKDETPGITSDIRLAVRNLNEALVKTSNNLNQLIDENRDNLKEGVANLKAASISLQQAMDNINKVTKEIGPGVTETVNSLGSISRKIDSGQGTLGKLVNDQSLHENINKAVTGINSYIEKTENFHTFFGYRGERLFREKDFKSYVSLRIQPKVDKYYLVEIVDDPRGKRATSNAVNVVNGVTTISTSTTYSQTFKFSAEIAKRFKDLTIRGGLIETAGGAGIDYNLFNDMLKLSFEAFDFSRKGNPHLKAGGTLYFAKYFLMTLGYDDFMSKDKQFRSVYLGLGFQFDDEDLKYLLSSAPVKF